MNKAALLQEGGFAFFSRVDGIAITSATKTGVALGNGKESANPEGHHTLMTGGAKVRLTCRVALFSWASTGDYGKVTV